MCYTLLIVIVRRGVLFLKKIVVVSILAIGSLLLLSGCGNGSDNAAASDETTDSSLVDDTSNDNLYGATINTISDVRMNVTITSVPSSSNSLFTEDYELIVPIDNAVIVNGDGDEVDQSELEKGSSIKLKIKDPAITTRSLPPVLAGNSLDQIIVD